MLWEPKLGWLQAKWQLSRWFGSRLTATLAHFVCPPISFSFVGHQFQLHWASYMSTFLSEFKSYAFIQLQLQFWVLLLQDAGSTCHFRLLQKDAGSVHCCWCLKPTICCFWSPVSIAACQGCFKSSHLFKLQKSCLSSHCFQSPLWLHVNDSWCPSKLLLQVTFLSCRSHLFKSRFNVSEITTS